MDISSGGGNFHPPTTKRRYAGSQKDSARCTSPENSRQNESEDVVEVKNNTGPK